MNSVCLTTHTPNDKLPSEFFEMPEKKIVRAGYEWHRADNLTYYLNETQTIPYGCCGSLLSPQPGFPD